MEIIELNKCIVAQSQQLAVQKRILKTSYAEIEGLCKFLRSGEKLLLEANTALSAHEREIAELKQPIWENNKVKPDNPPAFMPKEEPPLSIRPLPLVKGNGNGHKYMTTI